MNEQTFPLREEEQTTALRERNLCVRSQQTQNRGESELTREECVREKNGKMWVKWAGGKRTDSPATPLPKALTASTTQP